MQAVINASAEGTRLRPLSCTQNTFMLPLLNKPMLLRLIEKLKYHGIKDIVIITGYMAQEMEKELYGKVKDVNIQYIQGIYSDGVLKANEDILENEFIYISRPVCTDINFSRLIDYHKRKGAYVTCAVQKGFGDRIVVNKSGAVTKIEEKRLWNRLGKGDMGCGIYVAKKDVVRFFPTETNVEFNENILPNLIRNGKSIYAYSLGKTESVWDIASYMRANFNLTEAMGVKIEEGAIVEKGALLEKPCYIGKGAHIHKSAKIGAGSIIGENSTVAEGASIKRSIVGESCRIERGVSLRGCVVDKGARIGENTAIYEQAIIGFNAKVGKNSVVKSFVRIWPEKETEDNITLSENIMWGQRKRKHLFEEGAIKGIINVDITPRFSTLLGECVGFVSQMGEMGIATDGSASAAMIRDGIVSGLTGQGAKVIDFGEQPLPITRRAVMFYMLKGAIVINVFEKDGEEYGEISLIWEGGIDAGDEVKKRLEELYDKGEFLYPEGKTIKEAEYHFEYKLYYLKSLITKGYSSKNMKILLSCPTPWGRRLVASAMADFSCSVSIYYDENPYLKKERFISAVTEGGFDVGFILDEKCEKLKIVLPHKGILKDESFEVLCALIIMEKHPDGKVFVPVTASRAIEELAKKYNTTVIRTKTEEREMMLHLSGKEEYLSDQFILRFDGVGAIIKIMEFVLERNITFPSLINKLPSVTMAKTKIALPRERMEDSLNKIRSLNGFDPDNPEGVKITFDKGWVVVLPDAYKDVCHVVAEGRNAEFANELCDFCVKKLI